MRENRYIIKVLILVFVFVPSHTLFWDIISIIFGYEKGYAVFQIMFAAYFTLFSIFLTKDMQHFNNIWEKNAGFHRCMEKILHVSGAFIAWFSRAIFILVEAFFCSDSNDELEINKIEAQKQIIQYDNMPIAARTLLPVGAISLVLIILVSFNLISEQILYLIQEVMNTMVSTVGFLFVVMNAKENEEVNQDEN